MGTSLKDKLAKRRKEIAKKGNGKLPFFSVKEGTSRFRILPVGDENDWAQEVTWFYLGKELGGFISPITFGGKCKVMELYNKFNESKSADDRDFAKKFRPQKKFFTLAIRFNDEDGREIDTNAGPKPLLLSNGIYGELLDLYLDEKEAGDFTDAENGYDVKIQREGTTMLDTKYSLRPCKPTRLSKEYRSKAPYNLEEALRAIVPTKEENKELASKFINIDPDELDNKSGDKKEKKDKDKKKKKNRDL